MLWVGSEESQCRSDPSTTLFWRVPKDLGRYLTTVAWPVGDPSQQVERIAMVGRRQRVRVRIRVVRVRGDRRGHSLERGVSGLGGGGAWVGRSSGATWGP